MRRSGVGPGDERAAGRRSRRIGVVGLGAGTLAAYGQPGDYLRFYEINPEVQAAGRSRFTYLSHCPGKVEVVLGDARLSLEREPPQNFDLLVLDAFSSDAIPVHLLTEEAFALYERHLKTNGVIAVHISNGSLNLEPVVANLARRFNYQLAAIDSTGAPGRMVDLCLRVDAAVAQRANHRLPRHPRRRPPGAGAAGPVSRSGRTISPACSRFSAGSTPEGPSPARGGPGGAWPTSLLQQGDFAGAIARYRRALQADPGLVQALNNLAWLLATCPEAALRNGSEAVRLAEGACQLDAISADHAGAARWRRLTPRRAVFRSGGTAEKACALATRPATRRLLKETASSSNSTVPANPGTGWSCIALGGRNHRS